MLTNHTPSLGLEKVGVQSTMNYFPHLEYNNGLRTEVQNWMLCFDPDVL